MSQSAAISRSFRFWMPPQSSKIGAEQVDAVRQAIPVVVAGNAVNAAVMTYGLLNAVSLTILLPWAGCVTALCLYAVRQWLTTAAVGRHRSRRPRLGRAITSSVVFALPWGCLAAGTLGALPQREELLLVTVTAGMAGGGAIFLSPLHPAAIAYLIVVLAPIIIKAFVLTPAGYVAFGMLAVSYFAFLWAVVCWSARLNIERSEAFGAMREQKGLLQSVIDNFPGGVSLRNADHGVILANEEGRKIPLVLPSHGWQGSGGPAPAAAGPPLCELEIGAACYEIRCAPLSGDAILAVSLDVTERNRSQKAIVHLANHDVLTNLPNRFTFLERLGKALNGSRKTDKGYALLSIDLDRFKEINDTLGHPVGDQLLVEVAARLAETVRDGDLVARLGGDEFMVLQNVTDPARDSAALAERILRMVARPIELGHHTVSIDVSVGIALWPQDASEGEELSRKADLALLAAKAGGRSQFRYFEAAMDACVSRRRLIESGLRRAIDNNELHLMYQPILDLKTNTVVCFEALLRWNSPLLGAVSPGEFIPIAEETGLIVQMGRWVLGAACAEAVRWPDRTRVAINLSPVQFKDHELLPTIERALRDTGLPPEQLEIEVTETAMLSHEAAVFALLRAVQGLGVRVALDDFGTGHSSLANLKSFPFNKIKIDREFVVDLQPGNRLGLMFISLIASLGRSLDLSITAEGVETTEQRRMIEAAGCTEMQGYLLSKPLPAGRVQELLAGPIDHCIEAA